MSKEFDALYGGIIESFGGSSQTVVIPKANEAERIAALLKSRAEGYFGRADVLRGEGDEASAEAAMGTCRELAYVAKMLEEGRLEELEAKGR
jgi:hypothetical protein